MEDELLEDSASTDGQGGGVEKLRELLRNVYSSVTTTKLYIHRNNNCGGSQES